MKWDITITLDHGIEFPFENISNPKRNVDQLLQLKARFTAPIQDEQINSELESQKFDILVEALWEVVKDYIDKDEKYSL